MQGIYKKGNLMKLLYVTDNGFFKNGEEYFCDAANKAHIENLSPYFDEFLVVARTGKYEKNYDKVRENVKVHLVDKKNIFELMYTIKRAINTCDASICYHINGYFASLIIKRTGKVIIGYNGGDSYDFLKYRGNVKEKILALIIRYMYKKCLNNSDFGHYPAKFLSERFPANGKMLICSGVDIVCDPRVFKIREDKIQKMADGKIIIGLIGYTMNDVKGIDIAIKALSRLSNNYVLEIVGRGERRTLVDMAARLGCSDRVFFLGVKKPGEELLSWLDSIDIYIQPSRFEGLPKATIEAMSRGCPCVTSNAGALPELLDEKYVIPIEDYEKLRNSIIDISQKEEMLLQSKKNYNKATSFKREARDRKYKEFYTNVVSEIKRRKIYS